MKNKRGHRPTVCNLWWIFYQHCFLLLFSGRFDCVCGYFCAFESSHLEDCSCLSSFVLMNWWMFYSSFWFFYVMLRVCCEWCGVYFCTASAVAIFQVNWGTFSPLSIRLNFLRNQLQPVHLHNVNDHRGCELLQGQSLFGLFVCPCCHSCRKSPESGCVLDWCRPCREPRERCRQVSLPIGCSW